jgi:endonuclease YncB( thermonuclease family)
MITDETMPLVRLPTTLASLPNPRTRERNMRTNPEGGLRWIYLASLALLAVVITPYQVARAQSLRVIDGDTIVINKVHYRLWGIDAPETRELCPDGWPAGPAATTYIRGLLKGHAVTCDARGHDKYGRTIGLCHADGVDIQAAMVKAGMAWAFVRYSHDYVDEESAANAAHLGIFSHHCEPAWQWRSGHKH